MNRQARTFRTLGLWSACSMPVVVAVVTTVSLILGDASSGPTYIARQVVGGIAMGSLLLFTFFAASVVYRVGRNLAGALTYLALSTVSLGWVFLLVQAGAVDDLSPT